MALNRLKNYWSLWLIYVVFALQNLHAQWEIKNPETNYATTYANIFIQDDLTGFLLPADGYGRILRTRDKGETWEERVLPSLNAVGIDVMTSAGALNLWAGNRLGIVVHSKDGGDSWESFYYASPILSISFFDSLTGWILTEDQKLRHTMDGGKSWSRLTCSSKHIFAVNENTLLAGNGNGETYGLVSYDKGNTWEYLKQGYNPFESPVTEIFYSEPCNLVDSYRLNQSGLFSSRERAFYNTENAGMNPLSYIVNPTHRWRMWHLENLRFSSDGQGETELPLELNYPGGIGFFDEYNGILINDFTLLKTNDGGLSFQSAMVLRNKRESLTDLVFTSPQVAFMSSYRSDPGNPVKSELYKSEDGGNTWASFHIDYGHYYTAMAHLDNYLFVVGDEGIIKRFDTDTKQIQSGKVDTVHLSDIVFFGDGTGLICGQHGGLYRSSDRGQTWSRIPVSQEYMLFGLEVVDDGRVIFVSGPKGFLLQSLDSGISWGQLLLPDSTSSTLGIHFLNPDTGVVVGWDVTSFPPASTLYRTYDGGLNWDKIQISMANNFMTGMGIIPYIMNDTILLGTGDGISRLEPNSVNFEMEYSRGFGGPMVFRKDPSGGIWAVCNWSTLLYRESMDVFSLLSPENNAFVTLDDKTKLTLEWEKVNGAYEYRVFFKSGDTVLEKTVGDFLRLNSGNTYKMVLDKVQLAQMLFDLGLDPWEGSLEWNVWAINTEDTIKLNQPRTLNYRMKGDIASLLDYSFNLVPNPADENVMLLFEQPVLGDVSIQITDVGGKNIQTRDIKKCERGYIDVSTNYLSQGVYFITVTHDRVRSCSKLVIAR